MNGFEIIRSNVRRTGPDRVGLRFDRIAGVSDVFRIFVLPQADRRDPAGTFNVTRKARPQSGVADEWGCIWKSEDASGSDMGQVINKAIEFIDDESLEQLPDPRASGRFDGLAEALDQAEKRGLYVQMNSPHCLFERMHFLHGFDDTLIDCMIEPEAIAALAARLADFQIGIIEEAGRQSGGRIHCYDTTDDWGTQQALMIDPAVFRDIFLPEYRRIFAAAHAQGMDVRFHTDGRVNQILPDLIEAGANIINIHQPRLLGIDEVSELGQGKVCFEAAVDIQATLPTGDKQKIADEVKQLVEKWATPQGGLIGVEYGYLSAIGTTRESMLYALECFQKYGRFR